MNAFNRAVTVLILIIFWLAIVLLAAIPGTALTWAQDGLAGVSGVITSLADSSPGWLFPALRVVLLLLTTVVTWTLLWLELRPRRTAAVQIQLESGGRATVTSDAVAQRLAWHIDQLADVISVYPVVRPRGNGVDVLLELDTAPDIEIPMKTEEVMAVAREVIVERMGLELRNLRVDIQHAPFDEIM